MALILGASALYVDGRLAAPSGTYGTSWLVTGLWIIAGLGAVGAAVFALLALLGRRTGFHVWWILAAAAAGLVIEGLILLFNKAPVLYPLPPPDPNPTVQAAWVTSSMSAVATLRTATLGGLVGLAAIGGLVVNAINSRVSVRNLELTRESQKDARSTAEHTAQATNESIKLTREGQLTERYTRAVELLGNPASLTVRLGGIYALQGIATDTTRPGDQAAIVEVLSALIRLHLHARWGADKDRDGYPPAEDEADYCDYTPESGMGSSSTRGAREPRADVLAALSVLAQLPDRRAENVTLRANFTGLDFANIDLSKARLHYADLERVNLQNAVLSRADLEGANLRDATLRGATLAGTILTNAKLHGADLSESKMLRSTQLATARGDWRTKLPEGVERPPVWVPSSAISDR